MFFKMAKQHLNLAREIQCRNLDALIAHTSIVLVRYMFVVYRSRMEKHHRRFGDLLCACCDELSGISFIEALCRILTLVVESLRRASTYCGKTVRALFDADMEAALA
jgi:hypothetical protein